MSDFYFQFGMFIYAAIVLFAFIGGVFLTDFVIYELTKFSLLMWIEKILFGDNYE